MNGKKIYIFLGPPGVGKGSLSQLCTKRLGWKQLSTGNVCREHISQQTEIGKQIDFAIKSGKLISDSLMIDLVQDWLHRQFTGDQPAEQNATVSTTIILDGFPRTVPQARALHDLIRKMTGVDLHVVHLKLSDEEIKYRLQARSVCQNDKCQRVYSLHKHSHLQPVKYMTCNECEAPLVRRSDDEEIAIVERLKTYHAHEKEMLDFYDEVGHAVRALHVDAPLEEVYGTFLTAIGHTTT